MSPGGTTQVLTQALQNYGGLNSWMIFAVIARQFLRAIVGQRFWSRDFLERFLKASTVSVRGLRCYYVLDTLRIATLLSSSMAEHPAVNRRVVGSSPT